MKRKRVFVDTDRFILFDVKNDGKLDIYYPRSCYPLGIVEKVLERNGLEIAGFADDENGIGITIDRNLYSFLDRVYHLNQCSDIFDWFSESKVYEFTYYYDRLVFHHPDGFYAAYADHINNYISI